MKFYLVSTIVLLSVCSCTFPHVNWTEANEILSLASISSNPTVGVSTAFNIVGGAPPYSVNLSGSGSITMTDLRTILYDRPWSTGNAQLSVTDNLGSRVSQSLTLAGGAVQIGGGGTPLATGLLSSIDSSGNLYLGGSTQAILPGNQYGTAGANQYSYVVKVTPTGVVSWMSQIGAGAASNVTTVQMIVDSNGNIFTLGTTDSSLGGTQYGAIGLLDTFIAKYNSSGVLQWVSQIGGGSGRSTNAIQLFVDSSGNSFVLGNTDGSLGGTQTGIHGNLDVFIAKLSSSGLLSWINQIGGGASVSTTGVGFLVDGTGNSYVYGTTQGLLGGTVAGTHGALDSFIVKLSTAGAVSWRTQIGGAGVSNSLCLNLLQDGSGNSYLLGSTDGTFGGTQTGSQGALDMFIASFSAAGALNWVNQIGGGGTTNTLGISMVLDSSANIYLLGTTEGDLTPASTQLGTHGLVDLLLWKVTNAGVSSWINQYGNSAAVSPTQIYLRPTSITAIGNAGTSFGATVIGSLGNQNTFAVQLSLNGALGWMDQIGGGGVSSTTVSNALIDPSGNLFLTGQTTGSLGGTVSGSHGSTDVFLVKLTSAGTASWVNQFGAGGSSNTYSSQLLQDGYGNSYIMGRATRTLQGTLNGPGNYENSYFSKFNSLGILQ